MARNAHWHFGLPCSSFALVNVNLNKGTRSPILPGGDDSLERERIGNELLRRTLAIIKCHSHNGNTWSLENPGTSYVCQMPSILSLLRRRNVHSVRLHQCMFKLRIFGCKSSEFVQKYIRIVGNIPLTSLGKTCDHSHDHVIALGQVKTSRGWVRRST